MKYGSKMLVNKVEYDEAKKLLAEESGRCKSIKN
jgi:hypothetical protein